MPEVESLPRNIDFNPSVNSVNQIISYDSVQMMAMQANGNSIEDSMVVTGLQIQSNMRKVKGTAGLKKQDSKKGESQAATETGFRPNKFGPPSNKTCESF